MTWRFIDKARQIVHRDNPDGSYDSRHVSDAEYRTWLGNGGIPQEAPAKIVEASQTVIKGATKF